MSSASDPRPRGRPAPEGAPDLAALQAWFGEAVSRPLPADYRGNPLAVSAPDLARAAGERLHGRGGMSGFDRLGVYNQQYWFRLITILQEEYPCAVHVIGLHAFNDWAVRYLVAHPPASPYLALLDAEFPAFLEENYRDENRRAALQASAYDRAWSRAVDAPAGETLAGVDAKALPELRLSLAPHATPLRLDWDFSAYRGECRADDSLEKSIVLAPASACVMIWRDRGDSLREAPLPLAAWRVLTALRIPGRVQEVFARLEDDLDEAEQRDLEKNLSAWFKEWVELGWICREEGGEAPGA